MDDATVAAFARSGYCPTGRDPGVEAERLIENAVCAALAGAGVPFDHLRVLEVEARRRFRSRLAAGEGDPEVRFVQGSTGLPLTGSGARR